MPLSIYIGLVSLILTVVDSIVTSVFIKGMRDKIAGMIITIFYIIAVWSIFAISLVSIPDSFK